MDAATGASMWQTYIQPLANEGYKLISPATSSAPSGMTWMKDFFAACSGCTVRTSALSSDPIEVDS